jgi:Na+/H+ antiporter NhaC
MKYYRLFLYIIFGILLLPIIIFISLWFGINEMIKSILEFYTEEYYLKDFKKEVYI